MRGEIFYEKAGTINSRSGERVSEPHHKASLCSTSLRKPVWNLCRGSKVEKMLFFRESGVASSCPTAFWNDWAQIQIWFRVNENTAWSLWCGTCLFGCINIFKWKDELQKKAISFVTLLFCKPKSTVFGHSPQMRALFHWCDRRKLVSTRRSTSCCSDVYTSNKHQQQCMGGVRGKTESTNSWK